MGETATEVRTDFIGLLDAEEEMRKIMQDSRIPRDIRASRKKPHLTNEEANSRYPDGQGYLVVKTHPRPVLVCQYPIGLCGWPLYQLFCDAYGDGDGYRLMNEAELAKFKEDCKRVSANE